jgi:hypothetical protein
MRLVDAVSVDCLLARENLTRVDVLKTDTEGCEWEVLRGASRLLSAQNARVLIIAYENKWSASMLFAEDNHHPVIVLSADEMDLPTLRSVTVQLARLGYNSYLLGARKDPVRLLFVPLTGDCWHSVFELGRNVKQLGVIATWFDFVAVLAGNHEESWILQELEMCPTGNSSSLTDTTA